MKVTVCQLHDDTAALEQDWQALVAHLKTEQSVFLLLPELPFSPWIAATNDVDAAVWDAAVQAHDEWMARLPELPVAGVAGSRPVTLDDGTRHNRGFVYYNQQLQGTHDKYYLPDEEGFWEASWYQMGQKRFDPIESGDLSIGLMVCTDLWFTEHARAYGKAGVNVIANPRATEAFSSEKWLVGGRAAAIVSGAYCLSSNRGWRGTTGVEFGGTGWIIDPDGAVLATTSDNEPFVTVDIDLQVAAAAKQTYPRYVIE